MENQSTDQIISRLQGALAVNRAADELRRGDDRLLDMAKAYSQQHKVSKGVAMDEVLKTDEGRQAYQAYYAARRASEQPSEVKSAVARAASAELAKLAGASSSYDEV